MTENTVYVADHCLEFRFLHSGGTLGGSVSGNRLFDDAEDLCVCMDGFDWIPFHEKCPCGKSLNVPGGMFFCQDSMGMVLSEDLVKWRRGGIAFWDCEDSFLFSMAKGPKYDQWRSYSVYK